MYFIKKITLDDKQSYQSSQIVDHCTNQVSGKSLLENAIKTFTKEEYGRDAAEQIKILDIKDLTQVNEPIVDGILAYRLQDDPNRVHIYQRRTNITQVKNWTWGMSDTTVISFRRTNIFELEEYSNLNVGAISITETKETVTFISPRTRIIKPSGFNFIEHLKNSPRFQARLKLVNQAPHDTHIVSNVPEKGNAKQDENYLRAEPKQVVLPNLLDTQIENIKIN